MSKSFELLSCGVGIEETIEFLPLLFFQVSSIIAEYGDDTVLLIYSSLSNPVAITVILISSPNVSSIVVPKIMFASGSAFL